MGPGVMMVQKKSLSLERVQAVRVSEGGEGGSRGYATLVALVPGHHDVTIHPPVRPPAMYKGTWM